MTPINSLGFWLQFAASLCWAGGVGAVLHQQLIIAAGFLFLCVVLAAIGSVLVAREEVHAGFYQSEKINLKGEETR